MNIERQNFKKILAQFIKFASVGVLNTLIFLIVYYVLIYIGINYIIANIIGFLISVINAYILNKKYVFKQNNSNKSFIKVVVSYALTTILSTLLLYIMVDVFKISNKIAPLINLFITTPINFFMNKFWAFK